MASKIKITKIHLASYIQTCTIGQPSKEAVQQDLTPFISDTFTQYRAGAEQNYQDTLLHLSRLRGAVFAFEFEMFDVVVDEAAGTFACRFHSRVNMRDGRKVAVEIALFGTFNEEGKFTHIHEVSSDLKQTT
jgi:hypothetical protein